MKKMLITIVSFMAVIGITVADEWTSGGYKYEAYNTAPLIRVKYNGAKNVTATFDWDANAWEYTEGTVNITNAFAANDTVTIICNEINAATNVDGKHNWYAVPCAGLPADDIDENDVTAATAAINCADGLWHEALTVDTSALTYQDVCPWEWVAYGDPSILLNSTFGMPGLTGTKTLTVYLDSDPIYTYSVVTNYPDGIFDNQDMARDLVGLRINKGATQSDAHVVIRASGTASADSGGIGCSYSTLK